MRSALGALAFRILPVRRRIVLDNLALALGPASSPDEIRRTAEGFYAHLLRSVVELLRVGWLSPEGLDRLVRIENVEALAAAVDRGRGVLVLAGHLGNWELVAPIAASQLPFRFHVLRRALRPAALDRWVTGRFRRAGIGVIGKDGSPIRSVLRRLAAGESVVFLLDQHAIGREGVRVDFFGHPASTFRSLAVVALRTGAPVLPVSSWREPDGRHVLRFEDEVPVVRGSDHEDTVRRTTRTYNEVLERMILRHAEQWWWLHRRWKE